MDKARFKSDLQFLIILNFMHFMINSFKIFRQIIIQLKITLNKYIIYKITRQGWNIQSNKISIFHRCMINNYVFLIHVNHLFESL